MGNVGICAKVQRYKRGVENMYLNMHNSNKTEETEKGKPVYLLSNSFSLSILHILHTTLQCLIQFTLWL